MAKNLTVYYSRKGENYFPGGIKSIDKGNTEIAAECIQKLSAVTRHRQHWHCGRFSASQCWICQKETAGMVHTDEKSNLTVCIREGKNWASAVSMADARFYYWGTFAK